MALEWKVTVLGVRGSAPKPEAEKQRYGGNTSSICVECGSTTIMLDAGSGLSGFHKQSENYNKTKCVTVLISHLHLDHIQGLMTFSPLYDPECQLDFYGPIGVQQALEMLMSPPFWPVALAECSSQIKFHELQGGDSFVVDGIHIETIAGNHPGGSLYYRLDGNGKRLVYALDLELEETVASELTGFADNSDLLIWDSGFLPGDVHPGWGHSTWEQGQLLGQAAGVRKILMTHYGWQYEDEQLQLQEKLAEQRDPACQFAREGMVIRL